jgi:hypothetical protein
VDDALCERDAITLRLFNQMGIDEIVRGDKEDDGASQSVVEGTR